MSNITYTLINFKDTVLPCFEQIAPSNELTPCERQLLREEKTEMILTFFAIADAHTFFLSDLDDEEDRQLSEREIMAMLRSRDTVRIEELLPRQSLLLTGYDFFVPHNFTVRIWGRNICMLPE